MSTEIVTKLSHDQVALLKTVCGTVQNCARQTTTVRLTYTSNMYKDHSFNTEITLI